MRNNHIKKSILILIIVLSFFSLLNSQIIDSGSVKIVTRLSFYSFEKEAEVLTHLPVNLQNNYLKIRVEFKGVVLCEWEGIPGKKILRFPFPLEIRSGGGKINAEILVAGNRNIRYIAGTDLNIQGYKTNEVKTDRLTGGLIVNRKPWFPTGFYCYSPVYPTLPEEEVVNGFNMISPYQKILPETLNERKAYMDQCARVGIRVHYNLLSVSGGGGVNSKIADISENQKREMLINEIKTFMDHPALLAWYIADEPNGYKLEPVILENIYRDIKAIDPWHPVSMVFMAPFLSARKYSDALDIVMADPYPIPTLPVSMVGEVTKQLKNEFAGKKPVWIVPQAFGGGEHWEREPTPGEIRSMTWQSVASGATGIQYFVRQGPNSFPKSTIAWAECSRAAIEINNVAPWLLSDEEKVAVSSDAAYILTTAKMLKGSMLVIAVNTRNETVLTNIRIQKWYTGKARVMFENREVKVNSGVITDHIAPFGRAVYLMDINPSGDLVIPYPSNLIKDPGFEDTATPGIPASVYARNGNVRGATYFTDPSEQVEGKYSLRLVTPVENSSMIIRFFPLNLKTDHSYMISLWAKSDPERRLSDTTGNSTDNKTKSPMFVEVGFGEYGKARFAPGKEWKQYVTFATIPPDSLPMVKVNVTLRMPGQGVAWFDMVQVIEDPIGGEKTKDKR